MSQTSAFDRIVRRVASPRERLEPGEELFIVDVNNGKILQRWRPFRNLQYMVVSSTAESISEGPALVDRDLASGDQITLRIRYRVSCPRGSEVQVAVAFAGVESPLRHFHQLLERTGQKVLRERARRGLSPLVAADGLEGELVEQLAHAARRTLGLALDAVVRPEGEPPPLEIRIDALAGRVRDWEEEVTVSLEADLAVDRERQLLALATRGRHGEIEERLKDQVRPFLLKDVTLHALVFRREEVSAWLSGSLAPLVASYGRTVAFLSLKTDLDPGVKKWLQDEVAVGCTIRDSEVPIEIKNKLSLTLTDLGKWRRQGSPSAEVWYRDAVTRIACEALFEKTYLDLLLGFEPVEELIKQGFRREAEAVGFAVQHHVVLPDMKPIILTQGFSLTVGGSFATLDSRMTVELEVVVIGRIANLRRIRNQSLLRPEVDLEAQMRAAIRGAVEATMHDISPARYYMAFRSDSPDEGEAVEPVLRLAVEERLKTDFDVEASSIIPKPKETELTRRWQELAKREYPFEVDVEPLREEGYADLARFVGMFLIRNVRDWFTFSLKALQLTLDEHVDGVRKVVVEYLADRLSTLPGEYLRYGPERQRTALLENVVRSVSRLVEGLYGLQIEVFTFRRELTGTERQRTRLKTGAAGIEVDRSLEGMALLGRGRLDEVKALQAKVAQLLSGEEPMAPDDPYIESLQQRLAILRGELSARPQDYGASLVAGEPPPDDGEPDWEAYRQTAVLGLAGAASPRRLSAAAEPRSQPDEPSGNSASGETPEGS